LPNEKNTLPRKRPGGPENDHENRLGGATFGT